MKRGLRFSFLSLLAFSFSLQAAISVRFASESKLDKSQQAEVINQIKIQCPFLVKKDIVANSYKETLKGDEIQTRFTVQIPQSDDGDTDLTVIWNKGKVVITSDGDYCRK